MPITPMKRECCGTGDNKGRAIAARTASPAVEPVRHELLAGHGRDIGQPAPVELLFLNVVVHCCDVASVWRWQPERHNMVSQSPDWRGENGHFGSPMRDAHRAR